jgi:hypothetical protein
MWQRSTRTPAATRRIRLRLTHATLAQRGRRCPDTPGACFGQTADTRCDAQPAETQHVASGRGRLPGIRKSPGARARPNAPSTARLSVSRLRSRTDERVHRACGFYGEISPAVASGNDPPAPKRQPSSSVAKTGYCYAPHHVPHYSMNRLRWWPAARGCTRWTKPRGPHPLRESDIHWRPVLQWQ